MKTLSRISALCIAVLFFSNAMAWDNFGHQTIVKIAERHLTERAKNNISRYFDHSLTKEASWMDRHCNDPEILCTKSWHTFVADPKSHYYDPGYRLAPGDAIRAILIADWNLRHFRDLTDSAVMMNIRMVIHFVGDMHCISHCYFGPKTHYKVRIKDTEYKSHHALYDMIGRLVHQKQKGQTVDQTAEELDCEKKGTMKKIQKGSIYDWAKECADRIAVLYELNPYGVYQLQDNTIEVSTPIADTQLKYAGYRLARLLNEYFDN